MVSRTKKFRSSRTHGRGMKSGRGAGKRGGRGNAGLHKHKYMYMLKYLPNHFGRRGFKRPPGSRKENICINLADLEEALPKLIMDGVATETKDGIHIDLARLGVDKLLARGRLTSKLEIEVKEASSKATEKVENQGGRIILKGSSEGEKQEQDGREGDEIDVTENSEGINGGGT